MEIQRVVAESLVWLDATKTQTAVSAQDEATVLLHNDDITPCHYTIMLLQTVFELSHELAEHISWVAQSKGTARVVTRPRNHAKRLVNKAHITAQLAGFPLVFSLEKEIDIPDKQAIRKTVTRFVLSSILLLLAVSIAAADGAGDVTIQDAAPQPDSRLTYEYVESPRDTTLNAFRVTGLLEPTDGFLHPNNTVIGRDVAQHQLAW